MNFSTHLSLQVNASQLQQLPNGVIYIQHCKAALSSRTLGQSDMEYCTKSFVYSRPALWNSLPLTVRDPSLSFTQVLCATKIHYVLQSNEHNDTFYDIYDSLNHRVFCANINVHYIHTYVKAAKLTSYYMNVTY